METPPTSSPTVDAGAAEETPPAEDAGQDAGATVDAPAAGASEVSFDATLPGMPSAFSNGVALYADHASDKSVLRIYFENHADLCSGVIQRDAHVFNIDLEGPAGSPVAAGTFAMSSTGADPPIADVAWGRLDGACKAISTPGEHFFGKTGHVKVTKLSATEVEGEWDVEYNSGQKQTGTFRAPICGAQPSFACLD